MARQLRVNVTAEHIAKGTPQDPCRCPIALSLAEQHPLTGLHWRVSSVHAKESDDQATRRLHRMPEEARSFVHRFDQGEEVGPLMFELCEAWTRQDETG